MRLSGRTRRGPSSIRAMRPARSIRTSEITTEPIGAHRDRLDHRAVAPTIAPSGSSFGRPSFSRIATSVVVPPISLTTALSRPVRNCAPARLAAGPDRIVSIGRRTRFEAEIRAPSPRTTMRGAEISGWRDRPRMPTRRPIMPTRRALSSVVSARRGPPSLEESSWLQVTGSGFSQDEIADALFVGGIANGEIAGNGKSGTSCTKLRQRLLQRVHLKRGFAAMHIVTAGGK